MLKKEVLRGKREFDAVYNGGKSTGEKYVVVFSLKNNLSYNRIGFLASKKVGNSVERNRARRLLRVSFRNLSEKLSTGYDFVIIARSTILNVKEMDVEKSMYQAFKKLGVLKK